METIKQAVLFNSPLETGVRSVVILDAIFPLVCDLETLVWLDHLVVHTGDINGPESLHPDVPQRNGELLVRRSLVEQGLEIMIRAQYVDMSAVEEGIVYQGTDEAFNFVQLLRSNYSLKLKEKALWLKENICILSKNEIRKIVNDKLGRWNVEFQAIKVSGESSK